MKKRIFAVLVSVLMLVCVSLCVCAENGSADVYTNTVFADGAYKVSANVPEGSIIIFACYEDEALAFVDYMTYTAENADSIQFEVSDEIAYDSAKVFVWDGFAGMNAVKNPEIVNVTKIIPLTELAVVDCVVAGFNDKGEVCDMIYVYASDDYDAQGFCIDSDTTVPQLENGDVVVLGFGSDGEVIEIKKLYSPDNSDAATEAMFAAEKTEDGWESGFSDHYLKTGIEAFDNTYYSDDHWARVGFGIIVDRVGTALAVAKVRRATAEEAAIEGSGIEVGDPVSDSLEFVYESLKSDVNVYVYDYNGRAGSRASKGSTGNLVKTFIPASYIVEKGANDIYCWKMVTRKIYVFYKVTDGEVTDILIIKPEV